MNTLTTVATYLPRTIWGGLVSHPTVTDLGLGVLLVAVGMVNRPGRSR